MNKKTNIKIYIISFLITISIFAISFFASNFFNKKRTIKIQNIEDKISLDILSLETQFDLLENLSCKYISEGSILSKELRSLGSRLSFMEESAGVNDPEVLKLKRHYSLLEIKDIILMKKIAKKCKLKPIVLLYFYTNKDNCTECTKQGYVLTKLAEDYPKLRVYSFDYNLDLPVLKTLISINNVDDNLPAIVINDKTYYGFTDTEKIEKLMPRLIEEKAEEIKNEKKDENNQGKTKDNRKKQRK